MYPEPPAVPVPPQQAVLGIHAFGHEAGACLVTEAGVWALSEERLSRKKYDSDFPRRAISWALNQAGRGDINEVDLVVFDLLEGAADKVVASLAERGYRGPVRAIRHHQAHAAAAFFSSPFHRAAVLTIDAGGSREGEKGPGMEALPAPGVDSNWREVQSVWLGSGARMRLLQRSVVRPPWTVNAGVFYGLTSVYLGFGTMGAGKVMGLAAHGKPGSGFPGELFQPRGDTWLARCPHEEPLSEEAVRVFMPELFGGLPPRPADRPLEERHRSVAAYVQAECQRAVLATVVELLHRTGEQRLCFSGGFALNAPTNSAILTDTTVRDMFVQPAATDAGVALGCALWGYHEVLLQPRLPSIDSAALGGFYTAADIERALQRHAGSHLSISRPTDITSVAAQSLARGDIIGWFQGRSEFGPRALGHRSILADPRLAHQVERLNREIKFREPFRPYAPSVTEEAADEYFELPAHSPFMLLLGRVREPWRQVLPAICHVDATARIQTVARKQEPRFHALLGAFAKSSSVPILLNTSFNRAGEPIVETPVDALEILTATGLDALAIGEFWVTKKDE